MRKEDITLKDVLDLEHLQSLQDSVAKVASITTVLIGPDGHPVTQPSNLYGFCKLMKNSEQGAEKCLFTNTQLIDENKKTKKSAVLVCPHSGLTTAAVPIFLEDNYLGSWIFGQVRIEDPPESVLEETAQGTDMDVETLKNAMEILPKISREKFENVFEYVEALTSTIIKLAQAGYESARKNEKLVKLSREMKITGQMLTRFADSADAGMYVFDFETGAVLMANEKMARLTSQTKNKLIKMNCRDIRLGEISCCDGEEALRKSRIVDENGEPNGETDSAEVYNKKDDIWLRCSIQAIYWVDGRIACVVTYSNITQERKIHDRLEQLAYYDADLNLPNMLKLTKDIDKNPLKDAFLICFDITALRRINDVFGRPVGDSLLGSVAKWVKELGVPDSELYRLGGDEFCVCMKKTDMDRSVKFMETIRKRFDDPWQLDLDGEMIWVYCGISLCLIDGEVRTQAGDSLISLIARGLDTARERGGVAVYDEKTDEEFKEHVRLEISLKNCINNGMLGFDVYYQPIVESKTGALKGLEALCRWESPEFGPISPLVFIHEVEQQGLIGTLGLWVLDTAVRQCKEWALDKMDNFVLDVNFSPLQMDDKEIVEKVMGVLGQYGYPGDHLCVEITESSELNFTSRVENSIARLREQDILVALDDFGTGYSSFQNLKNIPVGMLKTERQFVLDIEKDSYLQNLLRTMVDLAHAANMRLVAEGVETEEQRKLIEDNGADYMQGYLFSRPLPAEEMTACLDRFALN